MYTQRKEKLLRFMIFIFDPKDPKPKDTSQRVSYCVMKRASTRIERKEVL
jgi:hypothetical protein